VAFDPQSGVLFVADTLSHTVKAYRKTGAGWTRTITLGSQGVSGNAFDRFDFPRGLALDSGGRLFVADDFNDRILIFNPPFANGEAAADSIGAGANGGFANPKAVAMSGHTLFVADYFNNRVLRFTGPFPRPIRSMSPRVFSRASATRSTSPPIRTAPSSSPTSRTGASRASPTPSRRRPGRPRRPSPTTWDRSPSESRPTGRGASTSRTTGATGF
jgi:hypothetical protein